MKILFLQARLSERGGADRWLLSILADLQEQPGAFHTCVAAGQVDGALPPAERGRIGPVIRVKGLSRRGLRAGGAEHARAELQAAIARQAPNLIVVNDVVDPDLLSLVADSGRGVMMLQDHRSFCPGAGKALPDHSPCVEVMGAQCEACFDDRGYGQRLMALTRRRFAAISAMRRVVVLSRYMRDELCALGLPRERVIVIPPFVDGIAAPGNRDARAGEGGRPEDRPLAAHAPRAHVIAGRLAEHKGIRLALDAGRALAPGQELVIAGDGPLEALARQQAAESPERLRFVGWQGRAGMRAILEGARSLWLPSTWAEPFGIIGLEALAAGVPVIASDVGGVRDWLRPEIDGLLVPPGDLAALSMAARRIEDHPDWARGLGDQGRQRVQQDFSRAQHRERWLALFETLR